ncbi:leucine-rich repeat domain-containing protein, partial [Nonomuraea indica]|uniref:leucine-rich repeat domain-containing protein n=1 Tax=Nonomuraea indica TaxID=1581193 RepID=UPI003CCBDD50
MTTRTDGELRAPGRGLTRVPGTAGDLAGVRLIDLAWNDLTELPSWLGGLRSLEELRLDGNRLGAVPDLSGLTALRALHLDGNRLTEVPACPPGLRTLFLYGNAVTCLPPDRLRPAG